MPYLTNFSTSYYLHYDVWYLQLLIENGAIVTLANKDEETPLDKAKENLVEKLKGEQIMKFNKLFI